MKSTSRGRRTEPVAKPGPGGRKPALSLAVQYALPDSALPTRVRLRKWALAALRTDAEVTLRLVDADEGRSLNRDYRGADHATNVLTFIYRNVPPLSGDIVLCVPVIAEEALRQRKDPVAHYAHLVVHGMLHLQGYDHENDADAGIMESLETEIVMQLGYPAPYPDRA
ncbi:MAG TPA: rRNA maturation RNase YbeY [Burkholderiales bacterium]